MGRPRGEETELAVGPWHGKDGAESSIFFEFIQRRDEHLRFPEIQQRTVRLQAGGLEVVFN